MIKNQKQAAVVKKEIENLQKKMSSMSIDKNDFKQQLQYNIFEGQLNDLLSEIEEYERLTSNELDSLELMTEDLPKSIVSFRIASGLTQKTLADKLEIQEQQIQRYEQNDYLTASFERIIQILRILEVEVSLKKSFNKSAKVKYLKPDFNTQQTPNSVAKMQVHEPPIPYTASAPNKDEGKNE